VHEVTFQLLDTYQRRLHQAAAELPEWDPTQPADRSAIEGIIRTHLGMRDEWVPTIEPKVVRSADADGMTIQWLHATSWSGVTATALLYLPEQAESPAPFVLLCCGHGRPGKLNPGYQGMARHLARCGAIVLCPDNIGQGEREPMGHWDAFGAFAVGLSLPGLILMETLGWLQWAREQERVDAGRMAAIGNSGGGNMTQLLIPFAGDLAAIVSSGHPSTISFVARKEKRICACNILPGFARHLEMHDIYGCFAPRPLLLMQGAADHLFPQDLFHLNARRVRHIYERLDAAQMLHAEVVAGGHSWDQHRFERIGGFLADSLGLREVALTPDPQLLPPEATCLAGWPHDAIDADALAGQLTGRTIPDIVDLWDVFRFDGLEQVLPDATDRGDARRILAQFEAFLNGPVSRAR